MAYTRRTLTAAFRHFPRRVYPSLPHALSCDDSIESQSPPVSPFPSRFYTSSSSIPCRGFYMPSLRSYSSAPTDDGSDKDALTKDIANVLTDGVPEDVVVPPLPIEPAAFFSGEVAAAAADCSFPVAVFQHLIDQVHSFTGVNWWAAIALTTIVVQTAFIPLRIYLMKELSKRRKLTLMPEHTRLSQEMRNSTDSQTKQEYQKKIRALYRKYGVSVIPYAHLYGICIRIFCSFSFYFAISNMVEKVPSLKGGGILWFTDLTTPDATYIFPVLLFLAHLASIELGTPMTKGMKNLERIIALLFGLITVTTPKAYLCWWITSCLYQIVFNTVIRQAAVKKYLGIP